MDAYIRQHKVWTPEQMHYDFNEKVSAEIKNGDYLPDPKYSEHTTLDGLNWLEIRLNAIKWLTTDEGKKMSLARFTKKYVKNKPIADRKSPIVERIRFGLKWNKNQFYDINFGLKEAFRFKETSELENIQYLPWSVEHVNTELAEKYDCDIFECLDKLSTSHLEVKFVNYWKDNYYSKSNPAIIPEVCGFRSNFYYFKYKENIYTRKTEILEEITSPIKPVNFRYDFLIVNFKNQKIAFVELDGFEHHKTRQQQTIDSIKRNNASSNKVSLFTFTSKRIKEDIKSVFEELETYLT
ncbi:hypothetical protein [uncultured Zobellia sp.]|uniref:hypothetical protein n=1 Tax=uncultured Zobellia sp. TaxID=255433 RepID=UPI0025923DC9|nr:hypothetical protein [uncultured Zobellia sp.]